MHKICTLKKISFINYISVNKYKILLAVIRNRQKIISPHVTKIIICMHENESHLLTVSPVKSKLLTSQ